VRWQHLVDGLDGAELSGDPSIEVTGITHDSRRVGPGDCFACIPGDHVDGHRFAVAAVDAGAVALLVERPLGLAAAEVCVPSVRAALGPIAARLHGHPSAAMRCLGITGTNGKTTTTYLLEAIARAAGERAAVIGTVAARIGDDVLPSEHTTPEADDLQALLARARDAGAGVVAMEVSSHALHQHRVDGTQFAAVCFTNLSHEHLDYHGSLAEYFEAKAALFAPRFARVAALNADDEHGRVLAARLRARGEVEVITYGTAADAEVRGSGVVLGARGSAFLLSDARTGDEAPVSSPLLGAFNVANACAAAATALAAGLPFAAVVEGLGDRVVVPGRMERVEAGQPFAVLVDYAHTPDALVRAVAAAREIATADSSTAGSSTAGSSMAGSSMGRVLVVFGCGGDRDRTKRPLMGAAAAAADVVVVTSDNPRSEDPAARAAAAAEGVRSAGVDPVVELDRRVAIGRAVELARDGDVVLVAGKGHEQGQTAAGVTVAFDDRVVAREELGARGWA
jgi:UDP-N-acetylmuramoyl-L-alanyl-D-glutamate--2,6-diaminopimelate ligase